MIYHQRTFVNEKPTGKKKLLQKSTKKSLQQQSSCSPEAFRHFPTLQFPPWGCEWASTLNEWRYFYPTHFFSGMFSFSDVPKNAQLLQALLRITISSSIQRNLGSVGKQLLADKRQYWFISPREVAVDFCFISQAHLVYVVKAMISGVTHKCTLSLLWNSKLLQGNCDSSRHEV